MGLTEMIEEQSQKIELLVKEEAKIFEKIKEKLKKEIIKEEFELNSKKEMELYNLVEEEIENYFAKYEERVKLNTGKKVTDILEKKKEVLRNCLKSCFKELKILIKVKNEFFFDEKYVIFKGNESVLMSFLIENFRVFEGLEDSFKIYIAKKELEESIKLYEVKDTFSDKLKENGFLVESRYNDNDLFIFFNNSIAYKDKDEEITRRFILQNYNLKINKKLINETKILGENLKNIRKAYTILEKDIKDLKIETITMLGIFAGLFSYLSFNFNITKELLFNGKIVENIFLIVAIFGIGLIPVIVIFFLIKYLFLMPNDYLYITSKKEKFLKKYLFPGIVVIIPIILIISVISIYMVFWNNYKEQNKTLGELDQKIKFKDKEIQILKNEINNIKLEYREKEKSENKKYDKEIQKITDFVIRKIEEK